MRITLDARDGVALTFGQRRFAVTLKTLTQTDDRVQRRAQLVRYVPDVLWSEVRPLLTMLR